MTENTEVDSALLERAIDSWMDAVTACVHAFAAKCQAFNLAWDDAWKSYSQFEEDHGFSAFSIGALALAYPELTEICSPEWTKILEGDRPMYRFEIAEPISNLEGHYEFAEDPVESRLGNSFDYLRDDGHFFDPYIRLLGRNNGDAGAARQEAWCFGGKISRLSQEDREQMIRNPIRNYCGMNGLMDLNIWGYEPWYLRERFFSDFEIGAVDGDALRAACRVLTPEELAANRAFEASEHAVKNAKKRIVDVLGHDI